MNKVISFLKTIYNPKNKNSSYAFVITIFLIIELLMHTVGLSNLLESLLVPATCYIICALALNICVGFSGELSLGHAGFLAIGAFSGSCVSSLLEGTINSDIVRIIIAVIFAVIVTVFFGYLISIPVLKLDGDYLAIVTLAFGQIIRSIIGNIYLGIDEKGLHFSFIEDSLGLSENGRYLISGPTGTTGVNEISTFTIAVILLLITLIVIRHLMESKQGRAIMASRDNRIASLSIGVDVTKIKTLAFVLSVALTGAAGAIYGMNYASISPAKFDYNQSILILVYVVLGGLGNINGIMVSTCALYLLPELIRPLQEYRMLIYALVLIIIMLLTNNEKFKEFKQGIFKKK